MCLIITCVPSSYAKPVTGPPKITRLGYSHYICSKIRLLPLTSRLTPIIFEIKRLFGLSAPNNFEIRHYLSLEFFIRP